MDEENKETQLEQPVEDNTSDVEPTSHELYQKLKDDGAVFTNEPSEGAGYIMANGEFLFLEQNQDFCTKERSDGSFKTKVIHSFFNRFITRTYVSRNMPEMSSDTLMKTDNAIRISDGLNMKSNKPGTTNIASYISLPEKELTNKQYDALLLWLDYMSQRSSHVNLGYNGETNMVEFFLKRVVNETEYGDYLTEDVIDRIKAIYNLAKITGNVKDAAIISKYPVFTNNK